MKEQIQLYWAEGRKDENREQKSNERKYILKGLDIVGKGRKGPG
jgi:hypothetical protein